MTTVVTTLLILFHTLEIVLPSVDTAVEIAVQRAFHIVWAVVLIVCHALDRNAAIFSTAVVTTVLMLSQSPIQKFRKSSLVFQRYTKAATSAVMAAMTTAIGLATMMVNSEESPVPTVLITLTS